MFSVGFILINLSLIYSETQVSFSETHIRNPSISLFNSGVGLRRRISTTLNKFDGSLDEVSTQTVSLLIRQLEETPSSNRPQLGQGLTAEQYLCRLCASGIVCGIADHKGLIISGTCVESCTSSYCNPIEQNRIFIAQVCQICGPKRKYYQMHTQQLDIVGLSSHFPIS